MIRVQRLLYLSTHQLSAFRWQSRSLATEGTFPATAAGHQEFARYLASQRSSVFSLLANVPEEGFQIETIPFLRGNDRQAVVTRKLGQLFFNSELTTAVSLGYQKSRRKDERILFAALTNGAAFAPWLSAMANAEVALAGIYSLPLLGPMLLRKLAIADERCLLLTVQDQSIRQSYLERGELHFSRFTPLHNSSIMGLAQAFAAEALKLQQYLVSQRLLGRQQPINAYLLGPASARAAIESHCPDSQTLSFRIIDLGEAASRCGLASMPADARSEALFLNLLGTRRPLAQFASDDQRHDYHLWLTRSALRSAGAIVLFACLLLSGKQFFDAHQLEQEAQTLRREAAAARERYAEIVGTFPSVPASNESLRQMISRYAEFERNNASPLVLFREISRALQSASAVEIDAIDWQVSGGTYGAAPGAETASTRAPTQQIATISGTLRVGSERNPRQVLAVLHQLVDALRRNTTLTVDVLQQPFEVESGKSLKGGNSSDTEKPPRVFRLQIRGAVG